MCVCVSVYMITYTLHVHSLRCSIYYYCIVSAIIDVINMVITIVSIIVIIVFFRAGRWITSSPPHLLPTACIQASICRIWPYLAVTSCHLNPPKPGKPSPHQHHGVVQVASVWYFFEQIVFQRNPRLQLLTIMLAFVFFTCLVRRKL